MGILINISQLVELLLFSAFRIKSNKYNRLTLSQQEIKDATNYLYLSLQWIFSYTNEPHSFLFQNNKFTEFQFSSKYFWI